MTRSGSKSPLLGTPRSRATRKQQRATERGAMWAGSSVSGNANGLNAVHVRGPRVCEAR